MLRLYFHGFVEEAAKILCLLPFYLVIFKNLWLYFQNRRARVLRTGRLWLVVVLFMFMVLLCVSYLRAIHPILLSLNNAVYSVILWVTLVCFSISIFFSPHVRNKHFEFVSYILLSIGVYVCLAAVLQLILPESFSIKTEVIEASVRVNSATVLQALGINAQRITFPMATGRNAFGPTAGACVIVGSMIRFKLFKLKLINIILRFSILFVGVLCSVEPGLAFCDACYIKHHHLI